LIYEYATLVSFLISCIVLLGASFYYNQLKKSSPLRYGSANAQKIVARTELWDSFVRVFIVLLLCSRMIVFLAAPLEILQVNLPDDNFMRFLIAGFLFSNLWLIFLILFIFKKEIKTENRFKYQISLILFTIFFTIIDLTSSSILFLKGYFSIFQQHTYSASVFTMQDIHARTPLLIFLLLLMIMQVTLFTLFFVRRSLNHVHQYWMSLILYVFVLTLYIVGVGLYIVGWKESSLIKLQLFSLHYGFWGWIFLFFFSLLIVSNLIAFLLLRFRPIMSNPQRARNLLSPLLKLGFIGLWGTSILCLTPHVLILFY